MLESSIADQNTEANSPTSTSSRSSEDKKKLKIVKQFEEILSKKQININELKFLSWNGIPFGKSY